MTRAMSQKKKRGQASRKVQTRERIRINWSLINKMTTIIFCLSMGLWGYAELTNPEQFPINHVKIGGDFERVGQNAIQQAVTPHVLDGFFSISMAAIQADVEQLPWVKTAAVSRRWPDTLTVAITQQQPVCRWNQNGIIATSQHIFYPDKASMPTHLPQLLGPEDAKWDVFTNFTRLSKQLSAANLSIQSLQLDDHYTWHMVLTNGLNINLGRHHLKFRMNRFVKAYTKVFSNNIDRVQYVDLRYQHGMAVKWRDGDWINEGNFNA